MKGDLIEGYTNVPSLMQVYKDYPNKGETNEIENFRVVHNNDAEKLVAHPFKLFDKSLDLYDFYMLHLEQLT